MAQPTLINFYPNEYSQRLSCDPFSFAVNLDGCVESCNTLNDLSNSACVPDNMFVTLLQEQINLKH